MKGADIGVGWIDNNGSVYFQVYLIEFIHFLFSSYLL